MSGPDITPRPSWDEARNAALRADLLIFDELGREPAGEWFAGEAARLIETRQTKGRATIVTTNLPLRPAGLPPAAAALWRGRTVLDRYGDRLVDRLFDAMHGVVHRVQGAKSIREMAARDGGAR